MATEVPNQPQAKAGMQIGGRLLARNTAINLAGRILPMIVAVATRGQ